MKINRSLPLATGLRRHGDTVAIRGDYQALALVSDRLAQRFWHEAKFRLIDRLAPPQSNSRIADVGCGSGHISHYLAPNARAVIGIDGNRDAIRFASETFRAPNLRFVVGQFDVLREFGPFHQIYCLEVLEHLFDTQGIETLALLREISAPGGRLFVTTPNYRSLWPLIEWGLDTFRLVPTLAGDQHVTHFTANRLREACRRAGWQVEQIGTFNGIAPFLAPLSQPLALAAERAEYRLRRVLPLNLLYCVGRSAEAVEQHT
jgi:2-polyprenyl-3-methyl-5-hydroxy-6-metoxy-1,4-benzoquinol methylase